MISEGMDLIHPTIIYKIKHETAYTLTFLFNISVECKQIPTRGSAMAEGPRDAVVSRNSVTAKHPI